ncbi:MAG: hypothetical protein JW915_06835 [Chitinispirillaceae bacterium]|nr:hypothetical protein [Chitinispirillaceae bacterium]
MDNLILQYNNRDHFQPVISAVASENEIEQIFAIPFKNCVGTYYAGDGITALECSGEIANQKMVFPLYDSYPIAPGQIFNTLPVNKDEIIWGLNLIFDIVNIKKHSDLAFGLGLSDYTEDIKVIDKDNYIILFKLRAGESTYKYRLVKLHPLDYSIKSAWGNYDKIAELTSEDELQNDLDHCQRGDFFFFYSEKNHRLQAYDKSLKKTTHPLVDAVNGYPYSIRTTLVHPTLPFAIFIGRIQKEDGFYRQSFNIVRWEHPDKEKRVLIYPFKEILGQHDKYNFFSRNLQFSPDGNWLIVHDGTYGSDNPEIVAFPIQKDNPMYLGKPIFLGKVMREGAKMLSHAWIEEPMKYVICDGKLLYSWELGKLNDRLKHKNDL